VSSYHTTFEDEDTMLAWNGRIQLPSDDISCHRRTESFSSVLGLQRNKV